nr:immunoglobulin heavy chain junction region [Homo sapiens]
RADSPSPETIPRTR